ncbi:hypothetical protein CQ018_07405 [Arthrobacter sp. MYb227]|uniref:hypothetical protein n=1 Tax=Arthrobacter sp. MYb227 TaxID=1848601 RepID=UPI000CFD32A6|nr:hypothetical protein [Arthrobacter sp. MYb227]PQZ93501.1 hypothetical protein CQ018_07405 [Arthrobacter sp. MYb227]
MNTSLIAESFILNQAGNGASAHLVSIQRDPDRAALLRGTRGSVQLRYHSLQLIPVDLIDDVPGIWRALLDALEAFLATGEAEVSYPTLEATILMTGGGSLTKFTAGKVRHIVELDLLIDGILSGATEYFSFAREDYGADLARIAALRG